MAAGIAPHTAPVVVVQAGAVAREVLGEQYIGQVVATRTEARDTDRVAVHGFVGDASDNREHAGWRRPRTGALDGQERVDWRIALVGGHPRRDREVYVKPMAGKVLSSLG